MQSLELEDPFLCVGIELLLVGLTLGCTVLEVQGLGV